MNRRRFLIASAVLGTSLSGIARAQVKALAHADMHSHIGVGRVDLRETMLRNGMLLVARTLSADRPVIQYAQGKGIRQVREPQAGELAGAFASGMARIRDENRARRL